jgi:hypothetical protein
MSPAQRSGQGQYGLSMLPRGMRHIAKSAGRPPGNSHLADNIHVLLLSGEDHKGGGPTCLTSEQALKLLEPRRNVHFAK